MDESTMPLPTSPADSGAPTARTGPTDPTVQSAVTTDSAPPRGGASFAAGRRLGSIVLVRLIGRGGMGEVWLGRDELLARDVAVKFVTHSTSTEAGWKLFLDGARAAAAVRHPRLVTMYSADIAEGVPYLVMEYVPAPSLAEVLRAHGPLSVPAALAAIEQAAEGIAALHAADIIHRDIKPGNLLLDPEIGVRVTDFGLAYERPVKGEDGGERRVAGTPGYMAPEMFGGEASVRTDVYALGATLFELTTAEVPFERALNSNDPLAGVISERLRAQTMRTEVADIIARALHFNPLLRTKTCVSLVEALWHSAGSAEDIERGRSELMRRARSARAAPALSPPQVSSPSSSESLHQIAETKRSDRKVTDPNGDPQPSLLRPIPGVVPDTSVSIELLCVRCAHGLRGVATGGRCPECGVAVSESFDLERLCFASRANTRVRCFGLNLAVCAMLCPILLPYVYRNVPIDKVVELPLASGAATVTTVCESLLLMTAIVLWTSRRNDCKPKMTGRLARAVAIILACIIIPLANKVPDWSLVPLRYEGLQRTRVLHWCVWLYSAREWIAILGTLLLGTVGALSIRRTVLSIPHRALACFASTTIAIGWFALLLKIGARLWIAYARQIPGLNARTQFLSLVDETMPRVEGVGIVATCVAGFALLLMTARVMKAAPRLVYVESATRTASRASALTSPP